MRIAVLAVCVNLGAFFYPGVLLLAAQNSGWIDYVPGKTSGCKWTGLENGVKVKADFKGDHSQTIAKIQVNPKLRHGRLAIFWHGENAAPEVISDWSSVTQDSYVRIVKPGLQQTWCGKSGECDVKDELSLTLKNPALAFGICESAEEVFYWDAKTKKLKEFWSED